MIMERPANQTSQNGFTVALLILTYANKFLTQIEGHLLVVVDEHLDGLVQRYGGQIFDLLAHCGGEQHGLTCLTAGVDDLLHLFGEVLVQHTIGLVQNENLFGISKDI